MYHVVATDNVTLRAEDTNHDALVAYAVLMNHELEERKPQFAKAMEDLIVFGYCELRIN